jgi:hypothetical protein
VDELIKKVSERAGINADQARKAIETVADFVKTKFPAWGGQIDSLLKGEGGDSPLGNVAGKIGGLFGH